MDNKEVVREEADANVTDVADGDPSPHFGRTRLNIVDSPFCRKRVYICLYVIVTNNAELLDEGNVAQYTN